MRPTNPDSKAVKTQAAKPEINPISRRQLLTWMGAAGVVAAAGVAGVKVFSNRETRQIGSTAKRFKLSDHPGHNPAYRAWATPDEGAVVWPHSDGNKFAGFRFNANGRRIWRLCDGTRPVAQVVADYVTQTGREAQEAAEFVAQLQRLAIVVTGGYVVSTGAFPTPPEGGGYHPRLSSTDPVTS